MKYWVLCAALWSGASVAGDVDPAWLRAWHEAIAAKSVPLSSVSRIGSPDEPGEPLVVRGTVFTPVGEVAPNVVVHSYHRDAEGFELGRNDRELRHGEHAIEHNQPENDEKIGPGKRCHGPIATTNPLACQWTTHALFGSKAFVQLASKRKSSATKNTVLCINWRAL